MRNEDEQSSSSVVTIVQDRWRLILGCMIFGLLLAALITMLQPRVYRAEAKFLVRTGRKDMVMGSEATTDPTPRAVTEEDVNSEIELLRSQAVLKRVVTSAGLAGPDTGSENSRASEVAVLKLFKHLDVSAIRKTNVIQLAYYSSSPDNAVLVLRDLINHYFTASLAAHSAPNSYSFFANQMADARQKMITAENRNRDMRQQTQLFSAGEQQSAMVRTLAETRDQLHATEARLSELRSRATVLESERSQLPDRTATQQRTAVNLQLIERLQSSLNDLRTTRIALAAKYKSNDSLVQVVDQQIASTEAMLATSRQMGPSESTSDLNPIYQSVVAGLEENRVETSGLLARQRALQGVVSDTLARLSHLSTDAIQLADLDREQQEAQAQYLLYGKRLEEARISHQMDQDRIANVAVIEAPLASPIPVGPSLPLNLIVGLGGGALLGFCLGWLVEVLTSVRVPRPYGAKPPKVSNLEVSA